MLYFDLVEVKGVLRLSKKWLIINSVIIALALLAVSFFVDDIMPFIYGAGTMNVLNMIACVSNNVKKTEK